MFNIKKKKKNGPMMDFRTIFEAENALILCEKYGKLFQK